MIKISVVTVSYNSEATIERSLKSVLDQDYQEIEYIIIDGQSCDGTVDVIKNYSDRISFWESVPDKGIYEAMNKGLERASGELVAFLNSDDWYEKNTLSDIAEAYERTGADIIYGNITEVYQYGKLRHRSYHEVKLSDFYFDMVICHQAMFFKTELIKKYRYDESLKIRGDYELLLRMYHDGCTFFYLDKNIVYYSMDGVSEKSRRLLLEETHKVQLDFANRNGMTEYKTKVDRNFAINSFLLQWREERGIIEKTKRIAQKRIGSGATVAIFGRGTNGKLVMEMFKEMGIKPSFFIDNFSMENEIVEGIPVRSPQDIDINESLRIIVSPYLYSEEILNQLLKLGFSRKNVILIDELL